MRYKSLPSRTITFGHINTKASDDCWRAGILCAFFHTEDRLSSFHVFRWLVPLDVHPYPHSDQFDLTLIEHIEGVHCFDAAHIVLYSHPLYHGMGFYKVEFLKPARFERYFIALIMCFYRSAHNHYELQLKSYNIPWICLNAICWRRIEWPIKGKHKK